jgi:hypothetical protein
MSSRKDQYTQYIASEHWTTLRAEALAKAKRKCEVCQSNGSLNGHHLQYRNLTDCTTDDILVLCQSCHDMWHCFFGSSVIKSRDFTVGFISGLGASLNAVPEMFQCITDRSKAVRELETKARRKTPRKKDKYYGMTKSQIRRSQRIERLESDQDVCNSARRLDREGFKLFLRQHYAGVSQKGPLIDCALKRQTKLAKLYPV